jgi:hypothetical protein
VELSLWEAPQPVSARDATTPEAASMLILRTIAPSHRTPGEGGLLEH